MKFILPKKYIKYLSAAMFALLIGAGLVGAGLVGVLPLSARTASADDTNLAQVGGTSYTDFGEALAAWTNGSTLTLLQNVTISETIEVANSDTKTLDLSAHTLSLESGKSGSLLSVDGTLTVRNGTLTGGKGERGGGVTVYRALTLENCTVSGNTASKNGGGVYVAGTLTLAGNTFVENNFDGNGNASNISLSDGNKIRLNGFTGRAGVTVISVDEPFAAEDEESTGAFLSDDKSYTAEGNVLKIAPLESITATFDPEEKKVFPTTSLEDLKQYVTVTGVNENGVTYIGDIEFALEGTLEPGDCELMVKAAGEEGEPAETTLTVTVVAPTLTGIEVVVPETLPKIYFDSPLSALAAGGYSFRGIYNDGIPRLLSPKTDEEEGDFYTLMGDFNDRTDGKAKITVSVGNVSTTFEVEVSKYELHIADEQVKEATVLQGSSFNVRSFVPDLPAGVAVVALVGGEPCNVETLSPGVYSVLISFEVTDSENYEEVEGFYETKLTVLRKTLTRELDGGSVSVSKTGGLFPLWTLITEDLTKSVSVKTEGSLEAARVYEITLEESGVAVEESGALTVRLPVAEELKGEKITLYLLNADGSLTEINASQEEDGLVFTAQQLSHARYVLAVETASQLYLILSIVFGAACALGAAAVLGYLIYKRKKETS